MGNSSLNKAKTLRDDEFYTQRKDVEAELIHYEEHFANKVVYMNADHPDQSQFWAYFKDNFDRLSIRKIIATFLDEDSFMTTYDGVSELRIPLKGELIKTEQNI